MIKIEGIVPDGSYKKRIIKSLREDIEKANELPFSKKAPIISRIAHIITQIDSHTFSTGLRFNIDEGTSDTVYGEQDGYMYVSMWVEQE